MNPRAIDLLCDRALDGLDPAEHAELAQLIAYDDISYELAAAAIDLSHGLHLREPLPEHLAQRIEMQAFARPAPVVPLPKPQPQPQPQKRSVFPWLAAAACFAIAVAALIWSGRPKPTALAPLPSTPEIELPKPTLAQQREELLAAGAKPTSWTATTDTAAVSASGDVVWDNAKQRGFMRFRGLAKNNPRETQYQLWIFDGARDERYPVDGGVFDIDKETGDVIIAIDPKIRVEQPTLFAVTVEKPGGVVVSNRERIVVTAKLSG